VRALLILLIAVTGSAAWAASTSSSGAMRISALDCEFEFPTTYKIKVGNEYSVFVYSPTPFELGSFTFAPLQAPLTQGLPPPASSERRGPLLVEHYADTSAGKAAPQKYSMTRVLGRSQQLLMTGLSPEHIDRYVTRCLDSMDPAVIAASQRRAKGCASELPLKIAKEAVLGRARPQLVFSGGKLIGWRIYGIDSGSTLARAGITPGTLLTDICGVPVEELLVTPDSVCCATDTSQEIVATFRPERGAPKSVVVKRGT
jgi:hypothetical protein